MAIHILPKTTLTQDQAKDWNRYKAMLAKSPTVQRYLEQRLKGWVTSEKIANPLQISWVRILFDHGLSTLERFFREFELSMGADDLRRLVEDTLPANAPAYAIQRSIASLRVRFLLLERSGRLGRRSQKSQNVVTGSLMG